MTEDQNLIQKSEIKNFKRKFELDHGVELYIISSLGPDNTITLNKYKKFTKDCIDEHYPKYSKYTFKTKSKERDFVQYIQAMSFLAHADGYSYTAIGKAINRNHATVMHSCKTVKDAIETNNINFIIILNQLQKKIDNYVGTISEDFKVKAKPEPKPYTVWDEARRIIAKH